jgi:flagellar hook-length control protein FliK
MGQAYPGGKFQVQYGDEGTATTTKAPLTEFVNQIPMEAKSDGEAQGGSLPDPSAAAQTAAQMAATAQTDAAAQLAAALPAAALDGAGALQTLQTPLAATTALLAPASPQTAPTAITAAAGNQAAASALGAGALPGASGSVRVTAPAASEASLPAEDQSLLSQVDGSIRWLVKNQDKGAELQLHPESLGRVQISIKVEGSVVHAKVWASEASTVPVLQDHKAMLEASLKQQGLTLGSFDLQHGRKDQQASLPAPAETPVVSTGGQNLAQAGTETAALTPAAAIRTSRIEYVA